MAQEVAQCQRCKKLVLKNFTQLKVQVSGQKHTWVKVKKYNFKMYSSIKKEEVLSFLTDIQKIGYREKTKRNAMAQVKHVYLVQQQQQLKCSTAEHRKKTHVLKGNSILSTIMPSHMTHLSDEHTKKTNHVYETSKNDTSKTTQLIWQ